MPNVYDTVRRSRILSDMYSRNFFVYGFLKYICSKDSVSTLTGRSRVSNKLRKIAVSLFVAGMLAGMFFSFKKEAKNNSTTQSVFAMDTYMDITAYGYNSEKAVTAAMDEIKRLDALLSTGSNTSEVTLLNRNKSGVISEDYSYLLKRSIDLWETTEGKFDITIYPIMRAWGFVDKKYNVPSDDELASLLENVNVSKIIYDENENIVTLPQGVEIDFGGIAKGYTSDRVAQIMKEYGIESAILNLGGNVHTIGAKSDGSLWKIAIKHPYDSASYLGVISIKDKAVITSGGYERYFEENGSTYHHIIDPQTGKPAQNGLVSVTIVSADGALADGLSTSLYVMGTDKAIDYWKSHNDEFDAVLCDDAGMVYVTEGLSGYFSSESEYKIIKAS